jgi:hypothetical protein
MAKKVVKAAQAQIEVAHKEQGSAEAPAEVRTATGSMEFAAPPAVVRFTMGVTINTGNFSFTRIDIGLELPCAVGTEAEAYEKARGWIQDRLKEEALKVAETRTVKPLAKADLPF